MKKTSLAAGVLAAAILTGCVKEIDRPLPEEPLTELAGRANPIAEEMSGDHVPNQLLVKFKRGLDAKGRANALAKVNARVEEHVLTPAMQRFGDQEGFFVLHTPMESREAVGRMKGLPEVAYAEPNYIYQHIPLVDANDYYYTNPPENLWGMMGALTHPLKAPMGSRAGEAWSGASGLVDGAIQYGLTPQTGSDKVYIGIIDEGVQYNHKEFQGAGYNNIFTNPGEGTVADKMDNDKNGRVDDFYGWDFAGKNNSIYDGSMDDHGTHVAGTIGARGNNGQGVAGVCWDVKMITAKFLGPRGGTTANAIAAVDYITDLKTRHNLNIVATNNSWGGGGFSQGLYDAIERANKANILFVAAAGNDGTDNDKRPHYPASYANTNIISVGSLWLDGTRSGFSNYGAASVDIFAPGQRIWSTTPGNTYANYSGTSMATPHVTGAVALYASVLQKEGKPPATAAQIKHAILNSAIYTASLKGSGLSTEVCTSAARLDAHGAWQNKQSPNKYNGLIQ